MSSETTTLLDHGRLTTEARRNRTGKSRLSIRGKQLEGGTMESVEKQASTVQQIRMAAAISTIWGEFYQNHSVAD